MTFEEFWKENYEKEFGTSEPYYGIASYAFEKGQENCNCVYTDNSNVIQKLEKENAELKAKNEKLMQMLASSADCENCKHYDEDLEKEDKEPCKNCFYDNSFWELKED